MIHLYLDGELEPSRRVAPRELIEGPKRPARHIKNTICRVERQRASDLIRAEGRAGLLFHHPRWRIAIAHRYCGLRSLEGGTIPFARR
jgi:hypothetical protein